MDGHVEREAADCPEPIQSHRGLRDPPALFCSWAMGSGGVGRGQAWVEERGLPGQVGKGDFDLV